MPLLTDSSFREKSGWAMGGLIAFLGIWYFAKLGSTAWVPGHALPTGLLGRFVIASIIGSIVLQSILAGMASGDAQAPADERERLAAIIASHWSGLALGLGAVTAMILFPAHGDGVVLFHGIMASLILSQVLEHLLAAVLLRRG